MNSFRLRVRITELKAATQTKLEIRRPPKSTLRTLERIVFQFVQ